MGCGSLLGVFGIVNSLGLLYLGFVVKGAQPPADGTGGGVIIGFACFSRVTAKLHAEFVCGPRALLAIIGNIFQAGFTGSAPGDFALYTDAPRVAFKEDMGVLPPVGLGAPPELAKSGSRENLLGRRAVETEHGRVSPCARVGDFVPRCSKLGDSCP